MRFKMNSFSRFCFLLSCLWIIAVFATACTTAWTSEAVNIINLLGPAISSIIGILSAFGVGLAPTAMTAIQSWSQQAVTDLGTVKDLIDQYNNADTTAKQGILNQIKTVLDGVTSSLATILPEIHVTDPKTQAKITAIIQLVDSEMVALINLVPALKGEVSDHHQLKALMSAVKSPKEFKEEFNNQVAEFGDQYKI